MRRALLPRCIGAEVAVLVFLLVTLILAVPCFAQSTPTTSAPTTDASTTSTTLVPPPTTTTSPNSTTAPPTTTATPTAPPTTTQSPNLLFTTTIAPPPSPTNATVATQTIQFSVIIGGGAALFTLLIGACYVTLMWQQKELRLYKGTFEEAIKERGKARREIHEVFLRGENRVFDYQARGKDDDDDDELDDLSPVALRAKILGQSYTAARYVEEKASHPVLQHRESPATYVGKGPIYYPPGPMLRKGSRVGSDAAAAGHGGDNDSDSDDATGSRTVATTTMADRSTFLQHSPYTASAQLSPSAHYSSASSSSLFAGLNVRQTSANTSLSRPGTAGRRESLDTSSASAPSGLLRDDAPVNRSSSAASSQSSHVLQAQILDQSREIHDAVVALRQNPVLKNRDGSLL